jgi:glycosyltransferase involved in cell wall biosynthesis
MTASVIVPSYNGAAKLPVTLEALCHQSMDDFETIVVLDGSTDNSLQIVEQFEGRLPRLKILNQPNRGRSGARNSGVEAAQGPLLIFIDDDIEVMPDNVARHVEFHEKKVGDALVAKPMMDRRRLKGDSFQVYSKSRSGVECEICNGFEPGNVHQFCLHHPERVDAEI